MIVCLLLHLQKPRHTVQQMIACVLNVRIDSQLKKQFDELCSDFGMSPSTAVNIFVRTLVRERRIPFEIAAPLDPFYGEANKKRLQESIQQLNTGKGTRHQLIEDDDE
ncbi:type II toxin-antitoxin system RelB/DinJ family antitoxin [uncultured Mailhella sp.]|uniref:type II toxin-antitoxin system RelB/DinJ family antitoxin n=1 Tax=uncultured Mailhella sp. TaxID=1981031 RepID=UPI002616CBEC|nr:type II toxin-antitoxin system RelB/DinJ family antitoxin [uncultured Mailhella sp.]